ncbi:ATP-binding cassette domain-containing protein [Robbsia sp. KACC 23696]|uniref:ABC transporter ATP-binding protein n=1 Tax=Robbsia sp. KACC 23696 TaxID=3149231 RepID=UPI00325A8A09
MASIALQSVQKSYGENAPVIRDVDLEIAEHEFCVFLGPSGCGKSTLLRMIAGLEDVSDGTVRIDGKVVNDIPAAQRGVAMVFQSYALFPHMTVYQNMAFGLTLAKTPKAVIHSKVTEAARILQLEPLLDRLPKALSGGQRQRVAIGRAIVRNPGVFLFDEPLSNLDATLRGQTRIEIARLHKQFTNASVVYVTHDQVEAMTLADKIVLLHAGADTAAFGSIAQVGSPLDLYHRPRSRFVAGFIGSPRMNFLSAHVSELGTDYVVVALDGAPERLRVEFTSERHPQADSASGPRHAAANAATPLHIGQHVTLGIRPEHLHPVLDDAQPAVDRPRDTNRIDRVMTLVEQLGEHCYLHLENADSTALIAKGPANWSKGRGNRCTFTVTPDACHLFGDDGLAVALTPAHQFA